GPANPRRQDGEEKTDRGHERRNDCHPECVVLDGGGEVRAREERPVVVNSDPGSEEAGRPEETADDRVDGRIDHPYEEQYESRSEEDRNHPVPADEPAGLSAGGRGRRDRRLRCASPGAAATTFTRPLPPTRAVAG